MRTNEGGGAVFALLIFAAVIYVISINAGTVWCRAGNIGQAAVAQSVCEPGTWGYLNPKRLEQALKEGSTPPTTSRW